MAICPTPKCGNKLPVHGRRLYCANCRARMAAWAKRRPAEVLEYSAKLTRGMFRVEHRDERAVDQQEALSQARRDKRAAKAVRPNGARVRI